jgi:hypothetical protein
MFSFLDEYLILVFEWFQQFMGLLNEPVQIIVVDLVKCQFPTSVGDLVHSGHQRPNPT